MPRCDTRIRSIFITRWEEIASKPAPLLQNRNKKRERRLGDLGHLFARKLRTNQMWKLRATQGSVSRSGTSSWGERFRIHKSLIVASRIRNVDHVASSFLGNEPMQDSRDSGRRTEEKHVRPHQSISHPQACCRA